LAHHFDFHRQVWNIAFSFYSSLKTIPRDLRKPDYYRFSACSGFWSWIFLFHYRTGVESMMSVAVDVLPDGVRNVLR